MMKAAAAFRRALRGVLKGPRRVPRREPRFKAGRFTSEAGTRDYKLYLPARARGEALPLVVMLHGCRQDPDEFAAGTRMNALADELRFAVLYPRQSRKANAWHCWNWFHTRHQQRDRGEPAVLAGMTRKVLELHRLDPARVYVAGLSAGGAMAAVLGATYPDLYSAVAVHSGLGYGAARDASSALAAMRGDTRRASKSKLPQLPRTLPTIVFHGDSDSTVHPCNAEDVIAQATHVACADVQVENGDAGGRPYTRTVHRDASGKSRLEYWLIHGGAHAWSGGALAGSYSDPRGPDASREMLRFFLQHS